MKFTFSWLKDHLQTDCTVAQIAEGLTALGLEVEGIDDRAASFTPFSVAYVQSAEKHPDADRLKILKVETAQHGVLQVVCGAPNARAGMKGIFAPAGAFIPGTGATLKKGMIRGQESNGMMVSEAEMGLSDQHDGIIEISNEISVGTSFASLFGFDDPVIEIKLTPNRADCAGIRGIARDLAVAGYGTLKPLNIPKIESSFQSPIGVSLAFQEDAQSACPLFIGRYIRGVQNGPSPEWLQNKLKSIGMRSISALVDITNFMTIDLNRPLHVFDADRLQGDVHVRLARTGEKLSALNDQTYDLNETMTVVCDHSGVLGLGGIIGGQSTGCTSDTVNVYLEGAYFDPARTARTGRTLQIESDARYRFERGIDPAFTRDGVEIATQMILSLCGGQASDVVVAGHLSHEMPKIPYRVSRVLQLGGVDVDPVIQQKILQDLGCIVTHQDSETWQVTPPSWRGDIEGEADLVEEVLRIYGFDKIPSVSVLSDQIVLETVETVRGTYARRARGALAVRGLNECVTYSFMSFKQAEMFGARDHADAAGLRLKNPINADWDQMRPSLLPNLILAAGRNSNRGFGHAALFEVGPVFTSTKITGQKLGAAGVRHRCVGEKNWIGDTGRPVDVFDAKADALAVLQTVAGLSVDKLMITRDAPNWYHPGRSGVLRQGAVILGYFGEIHPAVLEDLDVKGPVVGFEIFLDAIPAQKKKVTSKGALVISSLMPLSRDFAFTVDLGVEVETIVRTIRLVDRTLITDVRVFDVYVGDKVMAGQKSVAVTVRIEPNDQTLNDREIEELSQKIIEAVQVKTGGFLRA